MIEKDSTSRKWTQDEESASELVRPNAAALIESLRAFGYSPQSAIADLVDNSIAAGSRHVWVELIWDGSDSHVVVKDDGYGMDAATIRDAMRLGSRSPLEERDAMDLGRFGLGLKTASFSQCRQVTVASKAAGSSLEVRRWDLDYVNRNSEWLLLKTAAPGSENHLESLTELSTGTMVLWEKMDRIVGGTSVEDRRAQDRFLRLIHDIDEHLGMVFHRFLEPRGRLSIYINGQQVRAWDPFLSRSTATQLLGTEVLRLNGEQIIIQPYVLPHHSKIDRETHEGAAGPRGWNAHQGFYVYRNRRLLVAGDWLGLPLTKEEHYKLARIQIDIPNSVDHDWHIDVRKSRARPPGVLREDLRRIARVTREQAVAIYRHRGKIITHTKSAPYVSPWQRLTRHGKIFYEINREHPLVSAVLSIPRPHRDSARALVRLLEGTVPVPLIAIDHAERPEEQAAPFERASTRELREVLLEIYRAFINGGATREKARERLELMEPFREYPELIATIDELNEEVTDR